jgi:hypothetical protein
MTEERESRLSGLAAIVLAGAMYPSRCIERTRFGELKYSGETSYDAKTITVETEEVEEGEETQGTNPGEAAISAAR